MGSQEIRVSIFGDSVLVEGIIASLEHNTLINMQRLAADNNDILHSIARFQPTVFIYPSGCPALEEILPQMRMMPDVRLVALEICCNRVTITDSQVLCSLSLDSFQRLITARDRDQTELVMTHDLDTGW